MAAPRIAVVVDGAERVVTLGAFSQIAAKREYGMEALRSGDPEPALFSTWVELEGIPAQTGRAEAFDAWLKRVASFEIVTGDTTEEDDDADPPTAESSGSSPFSPRTSD